MSTRRPTAEGPLRLDVCIPRGIVHSFDNGGEDNVRFLAIATPGVFGPDYFEEIGAVLAAAGPPDHAAITEVMHRHGLTPAPPATARRIGAEHGMHICATDDVMPDHARRSTPEDVPYLEGFKAMDMDNRWVNRSPQTMLETFHWFRGEGFRLIVEDLLRAQDQRSGTGCAQPARARPDVHRPARRGDHAPRSSRHRGRDRDD